MIFIPDSVIGSFIAEDMPYCDLTCEALDIRDDHGVIEFITRDDITVCGTEEAARVFVKTGLSISMLVPSGTRITKGDACIRAEGKADSIHSSWKVAMNILEYCSGIATKTRALTDAIRKINPHLEILTTRKSFPGTKLLVTKSIIAGGALPHRLGLSETVLVFKEHRVFVSGNEGFARMISDIKKRVPEKKVIAEADGIEDAVQFTKAGIDGIQFDKVPPSGLKEFVGTLRAIRSNIVILAAGGITPENAGVYASSGINGIVTSALFHSKPADLGVRIIPA